MDSATGSRHKGRHDAGGGSGAGPVSAAGGSGSLGPGGVQASRRGLPSEQVLRVPPSCRLPHASRRLVPGVFASGFAVPVLSGFDVPGSVQGKSGRHDNARPVLATGRTNGRPWTKVSAAQTGPQAASAPDARRGLPSPLICVPRSTWTCLVTGTLPVAADVIDCYNCGRPVARVASPALSTNAWERCTDASSLPQQLV